MATSPRRDLWFEPIGKCLADIARAQSEGTRKGLPKWLRPSTLPDEVKRALRRTKLVYAGIPRRTLALWRKSDPRPTPIHFHDGTIDHKRVALIAAREAK